MMQDLQDETERAMAEKGRKVKAKGTRLEDAAGFKGDLADTTADKQADEKYLSDMVSGCSMKSEDFEARQKLRQEELVALEKATEILKSGDVAGSGEAYLPTLVQTRSFAMLRSNQGGTGLLQERVSQFLKEKADSLHSRRLSLLATHVASDPFAKVKKMIKDLIIRLMEEANQETEHKGWCDAELSVNKVTREKKTEGVNTLTAEAEQLTADIAKLQQEVADLRAEVQAIDEAVAKAAKEAQVAVSQALAVLKEFYAKAAEATALVQQ